MYDTVIRTVDGFYYKLPTHEWFFVTDKNKRTKALCAFALTQLGFKKDCLHPDVWDQKIKEMQKDLKPAKLIVLAKYTRHITQTTKPYRYTIVGDKLHETVNAAQLTVIQME